MIGWIIGLAMASMAGITGLSLAVALRLHFLDERHIRERDNLQAQLADRDETIAMQAKEHGRMIELHAKAATQSFCHALWLASLSSHHDQRVGPKGCHALGCGARPGSAGGAPPLAIAP